MDKFFNFKPKQEQENKNYLAVSSKTSLFKEILHTVKQGASSLDARTVFKTETTNSLVEYNIILPWDKFLILPANINQEPYLRYFSTIEEQLQCLQPMALYSNTKLLNTTDKLSDFFELLQNKINFYNNNMHNNSSETNTNIFTLILKTISFLEQCNNLINKQQVDSNHLIKFITINTILIYACPELADADILKSFLQIENIPAKFKLQNIYQHLSSHIFNNKEAFNLSLNKKSSFEAKYTFGLPKLATFFLAINYDIKTDKHPVEKIIRRYDEFNQKISDFFLHINQVMYDNNAIFANLPATSQKKIIECSAGMSKLLAEHGLLLEKANFSYLLSNFDAIIGGFFNNLNEQAYASADKIINTTEHKRHLLLISKDLITSLYNLTDMLASCINNTQDIYHDKKIVVSNIMQDLRGKIANKLIAYLDEHIIDLDHNFIYNKLMDVQISNARKKANDWRNTATNILKSIDDSIKATDFIMHFNKRIDIRKSILTGFTEIISALNKELGSNEHFLYDYCVSGLINQVNIELIQGRNSTITSEKLTAAFKVAYHSINQHINKAQDKFSKALVDSCLAYSKNINYRQSVAKNAINENNEDIELTQLGLSNRPATSNLLSTDNNLVDKVNKTVLRQMQEHKQLLSTLICAYSDNHNLQSANTSLIDSLIAEKPKIGKKTNKYATKIHELTSKELEQKINARGYLFSASRVIADKLFRPSLSRDKSSLAPAENIRKKNYIFMQEDDHTKLKNLSQYALQKTKLEMQQLFYDSNSFKSLANYLDAQIKNIDNITETRIINPMKWLINALNTIYKPEDAILSLKDNLSAHYDELANYYNEFLKKVYSKDNYTSWANCLTNYLHAVEDKAFVKIINKANISEDKKLFIVSLFKVYDECFTYVFDSILAKKLPSSLETVLIYQKIMAFHLGSFIINNSKQTANDVQLYNKFRTSIIHYNDHLKSLAEQMAFRLHRNPDRHADNLKRLDQTFKQAYRIIQDKSIQKMLLAFDSLSNADETKELMQQFNYHLDKLFELNFFEKYFGKQSRVFNYLNKIVNYCSQNTAFIPGAFVAAAVVNMFFTIQGTELLRNLQKDAPKLFNAIMVMKQLFAKMETLVPGLTENASIVYAVPLDLKPNISSCATDIYQNIKTANNISFAVASDSAESKAVSFLQSLYYKDNQGCPSGGADSFPPGSFVNWPNAITTLVSITSGAIACFSGWAQDVDNYVKGVQEYSSLPNIFQDFSPRITEKLLLMVAKQLPSNRQDTKVVYPGATTVSEFCLDSLDTLFNKMPKYTSRLSPMYAINWSIWALRYMSCGACSMAIPKRPHSLNEFRERVCIAASDRKFKTLIRMLGYNSAKEFIDVFSTKSGTLAFLLFLKEADFFEAVNEKAGISDYQVMKAKYDRFIWSLDVLSKNSRVLNSYQVNILKETYGHDLIDNLIDYNSVSEIEKSVQTHVNAMLHRIAGIASLGAIYAAQCANLYYYTFTPWRIAEKVINKLQGESVNLSDEVFKKVISASKKTLKREYTPNNLSFEKQFWHYIFAERASTKFEQSLLLWGIKETINLSMYLNATAHERSMGINTVNWELLGCLIAYLLKDSTGMFARFATLLDNESLRTFFSLLDKLDSPLAEKVLSEIGRLGMSSPQSLNNTINSMLEEIVTTSTGDINDIHRVANKKYQEMERIGITTFKKVSQLQEKEVNQVIDAIIENNKQDFITTQQWNSGNKAANLPPYFQLAASKLRQDLQQKVVAHGMAVKEDIQREIDTLDHFMRSNAYNIDYNDPLNLIRVFAELQDKISAPAVDALLQQKIISKVRCISPATKTEMYLTALTEEINKRYIQQQNNENIEIVIHQP